MIEFSSRGRYGLRLMVDLAQSYNRGLVSLAEVAQRLCLSLRYLEQLVAPLRQAGLVESGRGVRGGYRLSAPPEQITVGQVLRALEGPIAPARCALSEDCQRQPLCPSNRVWQKIRDAVADVLDSTTLADISDPELVAAAPSTALPQGDECR